MTSKQSLSGDHSSENEYRSGSTPRQAIGQAPAESSASSAAKEHHIGPHTQGAQQELPPQSASAVSKVNQNAFASTA